MPRGVRPSNTVCVNGVMIKEELVKKTKPFYQQNGCYVNAFINQKGYYAEKKLKLVIGSLSINGWFEFGGKNWTKKDFQAKMFPGISDSHCWLEDAEGNVYDYLFGGYEGRWVIYRTGNKMKLIGMVEGMSKAELLTYGVEYVPAPMDAQFMLLNHHKIHMSEMYKAWKSDTLISVGNGIYAYKKN